MNQNQKVLIALIVPLAVFIGAAAMHQSRSGADQSTWWVWAIAIIMIGDAEFLLFREKRPDLPLVMRLMIGTLLPLVAYVAASEVSGAAHPFQQSSNLSHYWWVWVAALMAVGIIEFLCLQGADQPESEAPQENTYSQDRDTRPAAVSQEAQAERQGQRKSAGNVLIGLASVLSFLSVLILGATSSDYYGGAGEGTLHRLGILLGATAAVAVIAYLISRLVFKKRRGTGFFTFAVFFLCISAYQGAAFVKKQKQADRATQELTSVIDSVLSGGDGNLQRYGEEEYPAVAPAMELIRGYHSELQDNLTRMKKELAKYEVASMLEPATLKEYESVEDAQEKLKARTRILDSYERKLKGHDDDVRNRILGLEATDEIKNAALKGFDETTASQWEILEKKFSAEKRLTSEINELLEFLKTHRGKYYFLGERIQFRMNVDPEDYYKRRQKVDHLRQKLLALQETPKRTAQGTDRTPEDRDERP